MSRRVPPRSRRPARTSRITVLRNDVPASDLDAQAASTAVEPVGGTARGCRGDSALLIGMRPSLITHSPHCSGSGRSHSLEATPFPELPGLVPAPRRSAADRRRSSPCRAGGVHDHPFVRQIPRPVGVGAHLDRRATTRASHPVPVGVEPDQAGVEIRAVTSRNPSKGTRTVKKCLGVSSKTSRSSVAELDGLCGEFAQVGRYSLASLQLGELEPGRGTKNRGGPCRSGSRLVHSPNPTPACRPPARPGKSRRPHLLDSAIACAARGR